MEEKIIAQGAEAKIILFNKLVIKDRIKKGYRIPELDIQIRGRRTKAEAKLLERASEIINCPKPFFEPSIKNSSKIKMPFINGKKLSEELDSFPLKEQKQLCTKIGESIAKLHDKDIIHGDLTTSNIILNEGKVYFIDFGLGFTSHRIEDKAVDLHLIKQALEAKHFNNWESLFQSIKKGYSYSKDSKKVLEQLEKVEKRGRYKH